MPATDWKEIAAPDEAARFEYYSSVLLDLQRARDAKAGAAGRALHVKGFGCEATLEVLPDVAADARLGMFAEPATYQALVRYSNGAVHRQPDKKPDVRGIAVKVFGVPGTKVIPGMEDATTQDFLGIRSPATPVRDAEEFIKLVRAARSPALLPFRLIGSMGLGRAITVIKAALAGFKVPMAPLAATAYYSALPITYGPYAAQYMFRPHDPVTRSAGGDLTEELTIRLRTAPVVYDLCVRFFVDAQQTPIEDASVEWKTELVPVARLTLPVQDLASARGQKVRDTVEQLAFDPWHARTDLRPLGNMMRARNHAYRASTLARGAAPEPAAMPSFE
jgi:hypothetical protein